MTPKERDLKELKKMLATRGWAVLNDIMEREVVSAAMAIATSPAMSLDEINFRRGSIWAAKQLLQMPTTLVTRLEGELMMDEATRKAAQPITSEPRPAMAGLEEENT